ncbi:TfuA-like protein [Kitasatospora sp. NPDC004531]
MRIAVFLGPSLPVGEARQILDAEYLPPARQADIATLAARDDKPDVILLIDGVFMQSLSVWHNEILYALQRGVRVYGASSMGALRAAETSAFGMVGIGEIYRMYADGILEDDDEVALTYAYDEPEIGYIATSVPMVNIRATLDEATRSGRLDSATASKAAAIAKSIYFTERTVPAVLRRAAENGLPSAGVDSLRDVFRDHYVDLKRLDAVTALHSLAALPDSSPAPKPEFTFEPSYVFETLYNRDRDVRHLDTDLPLAAVPNYIALHHPSFDELNANAFNRVMALVLGALVGVVPTELEIDEESERFRRRHRLTDDAALADWRAVNDVNADEFRMLMREAATCRKLHRWWMSSRFLDRNTRIVLDHMRLNGSYREWAERAADQEATVRRHFPEFPDSATDRPPLEELVSEQLNYTDWAAHVDLVSWCEDFGFHTAEDLHLELLRSHLYRRVQTRVEAALIGLSNAGARNAP